MGGSPISFVFIGKHLFGLKTSKNAMKYMILSFKMKGGVCEHFLMLNKGEGGVPN